jgi:hypothetical protein
VVPSALVVKVLLQVLAGVVPRMAATSRIQ